MANLIRFAKSGSDWTTNELLAFNIEVQTVDAATFFKTPELPAAPVSETILNNIDKPDGPLPRNDRLFFRFLKVAQQKSYFDDSALFILLRILNYDDDNRIIYFKTRLSFYMGGQLVDATPDIWVMDEYDYHLLVVQGNQLSSSLDSSEPQLIAPSIAAFYQNYLRREKVGLPPPPNQVILGIIMVGTAPVFYRIPVSESLLNALVTSSYPKDKTVVFKFIPDSERYLTDGMHSLENRRVAFQCLEAFKRMINPIV